MSEEQKGIQGQVEDILTKLACSHPPELTVYEAAQLIHEAYRSGGYVKLAEDQSHPQIFGVLDDTQAHIRHSYSEAGFRKVELEPQSFETGEGEHV